MLSFRNIEIFDEKRSVICKYIFYYLSQMSSKDVLLGLSIETIWWIFNIIFNDSGDKILPFRPLALNIMVWIRLSCGKFSDNHSLFARYLLPLGIQSLFGSDSKVNLMNPIEHTNVSIKHVMITCQGFLATKRPHL